MATGSTAPVTLTRTPPDSVISIEPAGGPKSMAGDPPRSSAIEIPAGAIRDESVAAAENERSARQQAEALVSAASLEIERLRLLLAKARREQFGQTSERGKRLIDQLELQLAELEEAAAEDAAAAEAATAEAGTVMAGRVRQKPARRPLPAHLPRERVVITAPTTCRCCGGHRLAKVGEVVTETLDVVPRRWFVRQTVREKFTCRDCETISEAPAPFHVIPRGGSAPACWR